MPEYAKGDIVWLPFPFSSDADYKKRPAIILASWLYAGNPDYLVCMISTQKERDPYIMSLDNEDLMEGKLSQTCYVRPMYTFAVDGVFIDRRIGRLKPEKTDAIVAVITQVLNDPG